jgi:hypothetical protein
MYRCATLLPFGGPWTEVTRQPLPGRCGRLTVWNAQWKRRFWQNSANFDLAAFVQPELRSRRLPIPVIRTSSALWGTSMNYATTAGHAVFHSGTSSKRSVRRLAALLALGGAACVAMWIAFNMQQPSPVELGDPLASKTGGQGHLEIARVSPFVLPAEQPGHAKERSHFRKHRVITIEKAPVEIPPEESPAPPGTRLSGIAIGPKSAIALFSTADGQLFERTVGEVLFGSTVISISAHEVIMGSGGVRTPLQPVSDDTAPASVQGSACLTCAPGHTVSPPQSSSQKHSFSMSREAPADVQAIPVSGPDASD